ncbi:hypothetical protein Gotur_009093 [Gossypium turneri]
MEFELVIERFEEGYLERFEGRILGFGEVVVVERYISSHLFLVLDGRSASLGTKGAMIIDFRSKSVRNKGNL